MSKISKQNDYEKEADELSLGIAKKSKNEKELTSNLGKSLDADFSKVRVSHEDLNGETAYTKGNDIHLDHSVDTGTSFGRQVLGHEMVHTAQQSGQGAMVSQAPAGVAQFFWGKSKKNRDLKLKNKSSYQNDEEYQTMYKAYNEYIKNKKNPEKKMAAIKAASDYMMKNTDLSGFDSNTNDMKKQKHQGRMAIAEEIIYNLTIDNNTIANATNTVDKIQEKMDIACDNNENFIGGMNDLKSVVNGEANVSKTMRVVTAGTLGNHMGNSMENLDSIVSGASGVTSHYDKQGNLQNKTLRLQTSNGKNETAATTLHELIHMANGNVYGNMMEMSIVDKVKGESNEEREKRYKEKSLRRYTNLVGMHRAENEINNRKFDDSEIAYAGTSGKVASDYLPVTLRGIAQGGGVMNNEQKNKFNHMNIQNVNSVNELKEMMEKASLPTEFLTGEKEQKLNQVFAMKKLNSSIYDKGDDGTNIRAYDMTSLVEYDSKLSDMLLQLELSGKYDENNPAHRRLKAMVMESFVERENQRIQNEIDAEREETDIDNNIKENLKSTKNQEILDDPEVREHVIKRWQKKGRAAMEDVDFNNGGVFHADFRGNAAWVTNYGMLMRREITKGGKSALDIAMQGVDTQNGDLTTNTNKVSQNIASDIRSNEGLQKVMKEGSSIFAGNETASPEVQQAFLTNFLMNRVYTPDITIKSKITKDSQMEDMSLILLAQSKLSGGKDNVAKFTEGAANERLNPILAKTQKDTSIKDAVGESLGYKKKPRRGFLSRRGK